MCEKNTNQGFQVGFCPWETIHYRLPIPSSSSWGFLDLPCCHQPPAHVAARMISVLTNEPNSFSGIHPAAYCLSSLAPSISSLSCTPFSHTLSYVFYSYLHISKFITRAAYHGSKNMSIWFYYSWPNIFLIRISTAI